MNDHKQNLLLAEEFLRCANENLFVARIMGICKKKALEIYHIEQAIENLQRGVYSMYGVPYVSDTKRHVPSKSDKYIDNLIDTIEQEENTILNRDKIDKKDIVAYSKNYSNVMDEIGKRIQNQRKINNIDVSEIKKMTANFTFSKIMVNTILSTIFDVKILDEKNCLIKEFSNEDKLKLIDTEKAKIEKAFLIIDLIPLMIGNMVFKRHTKDGITHKVTPKDLKNPWKLLDKGKGIFTSDDVFFLLTSQTSYSLTEIAFLRYITYPHINPSRYPVTILQKFILPSDYANNNFAITGLSGTLIARTSKNLKIYGGYLKSLKSWYNDGILK